LPCGFFSLIQKPGSRLLTIRARVASDLDALRANYLPTLSATVLTPQADYGARATATHEEVAAALAKAALDIDYPNFKDAVGRRQGPRRSSTTPSRR